MLAGNGTQGDAPTGAEPMGQPEQPSHGPPAEEPLHGPLANDGQGQVEVLEPQRGNAVPQAHELVGCQEEPPPTQPGHGGVGEHKCRPQQQPEIAPTEQVEASTLSLGPNLSQHPHPVAPALSLMGKGRKVIPRSDIAALTGMPVRGVYKELERPVVMA